MGFRDRLPRGIKFLTLRGSFQLPRAVLQRVFFRFYGRHRAIPSVVAVSRANRSLVVLCEGFSQGAGLAR
jgi:hypothetical protein